MKPMGRKGNGDGTNTACMHAGLHPVGPARKAVAWNDYAFKQTTSVKRGCLKIAACLMPDHFVRSNLQRDWSNRVSPPGFRGASL